MDIQTLLTSSLGKNILQGFQQKDAGSYLDLLTAATTALPKIRELFEEKDTDLEAKAPLQEVEKFQDDENPYSFDDLLRFGKAMLNDLTGGSDKTESFLGTLASSPQVQRSVLDVVVPVLVAVVGSSKEAKQKGAAESSASGLGSILSAFDQDGDGQAMDDLLAMAGQLFQK